MERGKLWGERRNTKTNHYAEEGKVARRKKKKSYPLLFFSFLLFLLQSLEIAVVLRYEKEEGATTFFAVAV